MARVARDVAGPTCTGENIGRIVYCDEVVDSAWGKAWLLRTPHRCERCGSSIIGYLDADLDPIRPPGELQTTREAIDVGVPA